MRHQGRYTGLQGQILKTELQTRIGDEQGYEPDVRRPSPALDDTYREDQAITEDPTYRSMDDFQREEEEWTRRPLGDT